MDWQRREKNNLKMDYTKATTWNPNKVDCKIIIAMKQSVNFTLTVLKIKKISRLSLMFQKPGN